MKRRCTPAQLRQARIDRPMPLMPSLLAGLSLMAEQRQVLARLGVSKDFYLVASRDRAKRHAKEYRDVLRIISANAQWVPAFWREDA